MAIDRSIDVLQGLLMLGPRMRTPDSLWDAESNYTESGSRSGVMEADGEYRMVLESQGTHPSAVNYMVQTQRGGDPEPGGASFVWKKASESSTVYRGHDQPNAIAGQTGLKFHDSGVDDFQIAHPHTLSTAAGSLLVAYENFDSVTGANLVRLSRWDPDTEAWSDTSLLESSSSDRPANGLLPCMMEQQDGTIVLYHLIEADEEVQVRMHYSEDDGASWTLGELYCLKEGVDVAAATTDAYTVDRLRCASLNGQTLLLMGVIINDVTQTAQSTYIQFGSTSDAVFDLVEEGETGTGDLFGRPDIISTEGGLSVYYINGVDQVKVKRIADPFLPLSIHSAQTALSGQSVATLDGTGKFFVIADLTAWRDPALTTYMAFVSTASLPPSSAFIVRSFDGVVFEQLSGVGANSSDWFQSSTGDMYPTHLAGAAHRGRSAMACKHITPSSGIGPSLVQYDLGGYSSVTMPSVTLFQRDDRQVNWDQTWTALDLPNSVGWTLLGGLPASTLQSPVEMSIATAAASSFFEQAPTGSISEGIITRFVVRVDAGGSVGLSEVALSLRIADGTNHYEVVLRMSTTAFRLYDVNAGAAIGADVTVDMTLDREFLIALSDDNVYLWHRAIGTDPVKLWIVGPNSGALTDGGGGTSGNRIDWGHVTNTTSTSVWREVMFVSDQQTGGQLSSGQTNPAELLGRVYAGAGGATDLEKGFKITSIQGGGRRGEAWESEPWFEFPISRVFPSVSPSMQTQWRSATVGTPGAAVPEQFIPLAFDQTLLGTADSASLCDLIGLHLEGINWRGATLEGYVSGVGWSVIATIDTAAKLELEFDRSGNTLTPRAGSTDLPYLQENELAGYIVALGGGKARRVLTNSEGVWSSTSSSRKAVITFEGADGTEPANGTLHVLPTSCTVIANLLGVSYAGLGLRISSQSTIDDYLSCSGLFMGPVVVFGSHYSVGSVLELEQPADVHEMPDGTTYAQRRGPAGRVIQISWTDGISISEGGGVLGLTPDPDFITASTSIGALPVATAFGLPLTLEGMFAQTGGAEYPVVALRNIPQSSGAPTDAVVLNRQGDGIPVRLTGSIRQENMYGEPGSSIEGQIVRVATVIGEELI